MAGCFNHPFPLPPPASPRSLACVLNELGRMGYVVSMSPPGSPWYQASRSREAGGDEIWIRLVEDSLRTPWLDFRPTSWNQSSPAPIPDGQPGPVLMPPSGSQTGEDIRTVRERCGGP